jgi:hypothetical protein
VGGSRPAEEPPIEPGQIWWRLITIEGRSAGSIRFPTGFDPKTVIGRYVLGMQRDSLDRMAIAEYLLLPPESTGF